VHDETVLDRQQHKGQHSTTAQGDDADAIADGQMEQRRRGRRAEVPQDSRGDLGGPDRHDGTNIAGPLDGRIEQCQETLEIAARARLDESLADLSMQR
jgi:hypothetical protein